jgi:lipopolysaccharide exporter
MSEQAKSPDNNKSSFTSDTIKLASGTILAQVITIIATPFIARLFTPEIFGLTAIYMAIVSIISVVACLRFELAIMLPESDQEASNIFYISIVVAFIISLLTIPVVWIGNDFIIKILNASGLESYLKLIPISVFFTGVFLGLNYWGSRKKKFGELSAVRIIKSLTINLSQLIPGIIGYTTLAIKIGAEVFGILIAAVFLGFKLLVDSRTLLLNRINLKRFRTGIYRYRKFPLIDTWSALMNTISIQLPAFLLVAFFSPTIVGYYALGYSLLKLPSALIGSSIAQVFYQRASQAYIIGKTASLVENVFRHLFIIGVMPYLVIALIGSELFTFVFGMTWTEAGIYAQILSPWLFLVFISSPISTLISTLEKQEVGLVFNLALIATRITSLTVGGMLGNARLSLFLFSFSGIILYSWLCFWLLRSSGIPNNRISKFLLKELGRISPYVIVIILVKMIFLELLWLVILFSICIILLYYVLLIQREKLFQGYTIKIIKNLVYK